MVIDSLYIGEAFGFESMTEKICSWAKESGTRTPGKRRGIPPGLADVCAISPRWSLSRSLRFASERGISARTAEVAWSCWLPMVVGLDSGARQWHYISR